MPLSHNQQILLTRQRHEAERMGLHWDYRIVVGGKAYSWATKKEMPEPGKAIILHEQPIHTSHYALSPKVIIPSGQYGAGVTTLDWVRKGKVVNQEESVDKFVVETTEGDRFLFKRTPQYSNKAWLFKNLKKPDAIEKKAEDGRIWLYHGSTPARIEAILKNGLDPKLQGSRMGAPDLLNNEKVMSLTANKDVAKIYSSPDSIIKLVLGGKSPEPLLVRVNTGNRLKEVTPDWDHNEWHYNDKVSIKDILTSDMPEYRKIEENKYVEKVAARIEGFCDTPGAIYHSKFKGNNVGMSVTLPSHVVIPKHAMEGIELEMHDAIEKILGKYFKKKN
jgi:hypothetical protein